MRDHGLIIEETCQEAGIHLPTPSFMRNHLQLHSDEENLCRNVAVLRQLVEREQHGKW